MTILPDVLPLSYKILYGFLAYHLDQHYNLLYNKMIICDFVVIYYIFRVKRTLVQFI